MCSLAPRPDTKESLEPGDGSSSPPPPPAKGYDLSFLDKLDDPNFNPFQTKTAVANTFDTSAVPPAAAGDTDKKPFVEVSCEASGEMKTLPDSAPTSKKPAAVQEKPPKKALPAKPWLKKRAPAAAQPAPVVEKGEAAGGEEAGIVAKGGYNMDFLDQLEDPNFNPFQTKSRVVSEEEAILPSSSPADLPSSSSADLPSSSSADLPSSSSAHLPSSSSAHLPSSASAHLPSSSSADLPSNSPATVSLSSSCSATNHPSSHPAANTAAADPSDTASADLLSSAAAVPISPAVVASSPVAADPSSAAAVPSSLSDRSLAQAPAAAVLDSLLAADIEEPHHPARLNPGNQKCGKFCCLFPGLAVASNIKLLMFFLPLWLKLL